MQGISDVKVFLVRRPQHSIGDSKFILCVSDYFFICVYGEDCPTVFGYSLSLPFRGENCPNAIYQKSVRAFYQAWYRDLIDNLPLVKEGHISLSDEAGWGVHINREFLASLNTFSRESCL